MGIARVSAAPPPVRLENLTLSHARHPAVHHLSGAFAPGSLTAVTGPNGAGKTTLLRAIAGLHRADEGRIDLGGLGPGEVALLPQASGLDRGFPLDCLETVGFGHFRQAGVLRALTGAERARARQALAAVGLSGFEGRPVQALSAGQFQRLLFARLIVQDAPVILLDEPFNAVDERTEAELMALIRTWHAEGRTVVAVLHDLDLVLAAFPQTLLLAREAIAWGPTAQALSPANRRRARLAREAWEERAELCRAA